MTRAWIRLATLTALVTVPWIATVTRGAEEVHLIVPVGDLTITEGGLPFGDARSGRFSVGTYQDPRQAMQPRVVLDGGGEIYLDSARADPSAPLLDDLLHDDVVAIRLPQPRESITGTLYVRKADDPGMVAVRFQIDPRKFPAQADAADRFQKAKARHYQRLLNLRLPGAAWFRHQVRTTGHTIAERNPHPGRPGPGNTPEDTYNLFTGGHAISENLQLDRPLADRPDGNANKIPITDLQGITVAEMDWKGLLAGKTLSMDPLATQIPADQHALFIPNLKAARDLLELYGRWGTLPVLQLAGPSAEDLGTQAFYEHQLGLAFDDLAQLVDLSTIRSLAVTGSDPYLSSGTDLALLFETSRPEPLTDFLRLRIAGLRDAEPAEGEIRGVPFFGASRPGRRVSSYVAVLGKVVVLTNSPVQLDRIIAAAKGEADRLADLPEYQFFRDRYKRGDADESAFLVLSDATIRRWCGPRWRIGSSRRVRAAAWLAEIQARNLEPAALGQPDRPEGLQAPDGAPDLGTLQWGPNGVASSLYGSLKFQTPIAELNLDTVSAAEADAYKRWRDGYQRNWRGVFDPIALRISARPDRLSADVSVVPLILASDYNRMAELVGEATLAPDAGDPHPEALAHFVMALDLQSQLFKTGDSLATSTLGIPAAVGLSWVGPSIAAYLDDGPFWDDLAKARDPREFLRNQWARLPLAVHVAVNDPAKLTLFLVALRAYQERTAPDLVDWTTLKHGERSYVRVAPREDAGLDPDLNALNLYYAATPKGLLVSLSEEMVKRFLDRQDHPADPKDAPHWLGESVAFRANRKGLGALLSGDKGLGVLANRALNDEYRDALQIYSWESLPILNEWKRLFPDRDPVAVHQAVWGVRLVCPGGGQYVWNERWQTMESTVFGHPGAPKSGPDLPAPLSGLGAVDFGLTLKDRGLRGRVEIQMLPEP